jgi:hypothetical protein
MSYEGHEAVPPRSLDELRDAACDCLEQYRERGMEDNLERTLVDKAVQQDNSSRLQALVARFEKAIEALAAFSDSSIPVFPTSDTLARNAPALRHEHTVALPLYGTACEAPVFCRHDHAAPPAAPSEISLPEYGPLYPTSDTLACIISNFRYSRSESRSQRAGAAP